MTRPSGIFLGLLPTLFTMWAAAPRCLAEDKILFIGNSFTFGDMGTTGVPQIFDALANAGGHPDPTVVMRAVAGKNFQYHENDATSRSVIASQQWTHVVLQNFSTEPTHIGSVANHTTYGTALYNRVLANNAATRVILYETWSRADNHALISGASTPATFASTGEMQSELRTHYANLAASLNSANPANAPVVVTPVGDAWENAGGLLPASHPEFEDLFGSDNYHGNDNGYFLSAATFYAKIYGQSPEGLHTHAAVTALNLNLTVDPVFLEQIAWGTVTGTLPIRYTTQPASLTVTEGQSATFRAEILGSLPVTGIQWSRNGTPIPGADQLSYTLPNVPAGHDGSLYTVTVSNAVSSPVSATATLTVIHDSVPPVAGVPTLADATHVQLGFNEALATGPAQSVQNYTVIFRGQSIAVSSAQLSADGKTVTLTLGSPLEAGYVVTLGGITDVAGNPVAPGSVAVSPSPASAIAGKILVDFGVTGTPTGPADDPANTWNNIGTTIGQSNTAKLDPLLNRAGTASGVRLEMVRRFNGHNPDGATTGSPFPASASRDSLFGNTEVFNGLTNVLPAFRLAGLDPATTYSLEFYASRNGVSDNRGTLYTVTGAAVATASLNASNNVTTTATLTALVPDPAGNLLVELSPTAQNNSANHFTYIGVLVVTPEIQAVPAFYPTAVAGGRIVLDWTGSAELQKSATLSGDWQPVTPAPVPPYTELLTNGANFFRLAYPEP